MIKARIFQDITRDTFRNVYVKKMLPHLCVANLVNCQRNSRLAVCVFGHLLTALGLRSFNVFTIGFLLAAIYRRTKLALSILHASLLFIGELDKDRFIDYVN